MRSLLFAVAGLLLTGSAQAAVLYESAGAAYTSPSSTICGTCPGIPNAQIFSSFVLGQDGSINQISYDTYTPSTLPEVSFYSGIPSQPGPLLLRYRLTQADVVGASQPNGGGGAIVTANLPMFNATAGTDYVLSLYDQNSFLWSGLGATRTSTFISGDGPGRGQQDTGAIFTLSNVAAAPEPASWAMMIAGFGIAGGALRRSRKLRATSTKVAIA